jgi:hypothetical protein
MRTPVVPNMLSEILTFTIGSGLLLTVAGFIARSVFRHYLDRDIKAFKAKLEAEARKRQVVFEKLYERKLEVISSLHSAAVEAGRAVTYAVQMQGNIKPENIPHLEQQVKAFKEEYEDSRIWLNDGCCKALDRLVDEQSIFYKVVNAASLAKENLGKDWIGGEMLELWRRADKDLPAAQNELRSAFHEAMRSVEA